jgi:hypothetical protein
LVAVSGSVERATIAIFLVIRRAPPSRAECLQEIPRCKAQTGAFYLGRSTADQMLGRAGNDSMGRRR